CMQALEFPYTF
nr:immunoglobulin light chain junction region [Macaca mulatta]MOV78585.1 immunoglobulin light chain junction region [Macaca mulatta]MOV78654.1 immunoglobulin light chain junction region [Macaca mulatta]MOV79286.1 immunoglobulin light chain junction region [Macaca mulatta]MOV81244.1 immunoglobulin light chain junction region [Macaca mulatta]